MTEEKFTIGRLSRATGCKVPTIRYFEKIGMLPEPGRTAGNSRVYTSEHEELLRFILHCRELGFSQATVKELINLSRRPAQSCDAVSEISRKHLDSIVLKISRLEALKTELEAMISSCEGGTISQCQLIKALADHSHADCFTHRFEAA